MRVHFKLKRFLVWLLTLRGSSNAIALGFAIGVFIAFTPTIGLQIVLAVLLATLCNANRPAAAVPVWITNPLTIPPIFAFTYWVGSWFVAGPSVEQVRSQLTQIVGGLEGYSFWEVYDQFLHFLNFARSIMMPLTIGGCLVGLVAATPSFFVARWLVERVRAIRGATRLGRAKKGRHGQDQPPPPPPPAQARGPARRESLTKPAARRPADPRL